MSFFSSKSKDKDPFTKKSQFYVEFLGWMECRGLRGQRYTDPVIRELRRRQKKMDRPPKLTIQVSRKELQITQDVEEKKKNIKTIKFPTIPARDVTYVHQATRPEDGRLDDIVACIYLGYMPRTQRFVHVHVYRFDEPNTASIFASQMAALVEANMEHIRKVEIDLANEGQVDDPRLTSSDGMSEPHTTDSASSAYSDDGSPTFGSDEIDPDLQSLKDVEAFDNVADELKFRLQMKDTPLLLPPKDYDTISRAHGNLDEAKKRRCLNLNIVGEFSQARDRNGSTESGVDLTSPGSDGGDTGEKGSADITSSPKLKKEGSFDSPWNSPQVPHKRKPSPDLNNSHLAPPTSTNQKGVKMSPEIPRKPDFPDLNGYPHSRSDISPGTPPPFKDFVYPPKVTSPPMSPRLYRPVHSRQNSQNSQHGSDYDHREPAPLQHYKSESSDDIYTMPMARIAHNRMAPAVVEIPPDYNDDIEDGVHMRMGHVFRQPHLTRSMPAELIRSEMNVGNNSRPNSGEFRRLRRTESPVFVGGYHALAGNAGRHSPHIQRHGVSKR